MRVARSGLSSEIHRLAPEGEPHLAQSAEAEAFELARFSLGPADGNNEAMPGTEVP